MPLLDEHRAEIADIVAVSQAELVERWREMPLGDREAARAALAEALTETSLTYGRLAAGAAADWYLQVRREQVAGRYSPTMRLPLSPEQVQSNAGWATAPLIRPGGAEVALSRAGGALQRLVAGADRETVIANVARDRQASGWYRGASSNCCSFCAMTAARGAVYRSESTASFESHNHCRCFAAPSFNGRFDDLPDYYDQFGSEYDAAVAKVNELGESRTAKNILREMRTVSGRN